VTAVVSNSSISLVICTRDRAVQLARSLKSVASLCCSVPWELIVVDNGSSDETSSVLADFGRSYSGTLRVLREPRLGLARARNRGLEFASGGIVVFTDDDCYPAPDYLARVHTCFVEEPALGFLGGQIRLYDPADLPMTILVAQERREFRPPSFIRPGDIQGANMAFRREALEEIGGFDVRLGPGTPYVADDIDAIVRLSASGWLGAYDPRPLVYHHHGRKSRSDVKSLLRSYQRGAGAYYVKCLSNPRTRSACTRWIVRRAFTRPRYAVREFGGALRFWLSSRASRG
jgi:GT2 family glycosyltransferase